MEESEAQTSTPVAGNGGLKNGDSKKPQIHLVKKSRVSPIMSMQVEDEVEIMDDSEDELIVSRSSNKRDYSRDKLFTMNDLDDDNEEELSLLYEDEDVKPELDENGHIQKNGDGEEHLSEDNFEEDAERIMNKRGKRPKKAEDQVETEATSEDEDKPLASTRRRRSVKVVQAVVEPEVKVEAEEDLEVTFNSVTTVKEEVTEEAAAAEDGDKSDLQSLAESLVEDEDEDNEDNRSEVSADDDSLPSTFSLGDLAWARVGTAPYWPSIITMDPDSKTKFTHVKMHRNSGLKREYHVQFFGRVQRAWIISSSMLKFEGLEAFNELGKKVTGKARAAFLPKSHNREVWNEGIKECQTFTDKSNEERLEISAKMLKEQQNNPSKKRRRTSCESPDVIQQSKKPRFDEAEKLIEAIPLKVLENNKRKLKTGFKLFQLANRAEAIKEHGEELLEKTLSKMWSTASAAEKKFYQDKAASFLKAECAETESVADLSIESEAKSKTPVRSKNHNKTSTRSENMIGLFKKDLCCLICEEGSQAPNDTVKCKGVCGGQTFHVQCLPKEDVENVNDKWKCRECVTNKHRCHLCGEDNGDVVKCNRNNCGRFYHIDCLQNHGLWPQHRLVGDNILTCPAHICHTCASDNPKDPYMKYNSKIVKCIRCPTAYHSGDYCVAAGTVQISASQIVCPKHYEPDTKSTKKKTATHVNTSWCFICSKGGSLICCEQCPASFHTECLKIDLPPEGKYFCDNCETGRMPLYGEVLWVKLGKYRWWPARVLHPSEVPANIEKLNHDVGEFPIQFCGSKEYAWMNRGRCFLYEEGDSDKIPGMGSASGGLDGSYSRGLSEAAELFEEYNQERLKRETDNAAKGRLNSNCKPPLFNKIKSNKPFGDCPVYSIDPTDKQSCDCDPKSDLPCGPDSDCINRLLMTECRPSTCKSGERCHNQRFQKRVYPPLKVLRTPNRGWGLYVLADVKKGDFLIEYVGELITMEEFRRRIQNSIDRKEEQNYYYMTMDSQRMLDAGPRGNIARFMNHSCDPNAETQKWTVNGDTRVGLFALADIPAGTELTFNYQFEAMGEVKKMCLCGAKNCSGYIGEKAKSLAKEKKTSNGQLQKKTKVKLKAIQKKPSKVWEDLCFRCFDDGEVLMCDWKQCPKVYHLTCLGRDKMPREKWYCPWHHCVECGKLAIAHCIHCPNAYCKAHNSALKEHKELGRICDEHKDDIGDLIKFYRRVGGVAHLVPNPNVPITECKQGPIEEPIEPKRRRRDDVDKENSQQQGPNKSRVSSPSVAPFGQKNPFQYKCVVEGCLFRTRRTRLFAHYVNTHKMAPEEAEKVVPQRMISTSDTERLNCPLCEHLCLPIMLRRHLFQSHKQDLTMDEIDLVFEETIKSKANRVKATAAAKAVAAVAAATDAAAVNATDLEKNPLFSKVQPDGRVACKAPECTMMVSAQNIARHWNQYHPELKKDDYQPSLRKLLRLMNQSESPASVASPLRQGPQSPEPSSLMTKKTPHSAPGGKRIRCGNSGCNFRTLSRLKMAEHRKLLGHLSPKKKGMLPSPAKSLPMTICGFENCDFETRYHSNMMRHRKRRNHYLSEDDKIQAKEEEKRDEIARQIEQSKTESETESSDELDLTIPLSKKYSPSKITDYFKPLSKRKNSLESVKKTLDMDAEEAPEKCTNSKDLDKFAKEETYKAPTTVLEQ